jgi:hypothetical protein
LGDVTGSGDGLCVVGFDDWLSAGLGVAGAGDGLKVHKVCGDGLCGWLGDGLAGCCAASLIWFAAGVAVLLLLAWWSCCFGSGAFGACSWFAGGLLEGLGGLGEEAAALGGAGDG